MKLLVSLGLALVLSGCGGGGGGSTPPPPPSTGLTVRFSTSTFVAEQLEGSMPVSQTITGSATGATDKDLLMGAEVTGNGIALPIQISVDPNARTAAINVSPRGGLAAGTYTGTIRLLACTTQACTVHHAGSPHTINYTVTVLPSLKPSTYAVDMAALEAGAAVRDITFTPPAGNVTVSAQIDYRSAQTGWLSAAFAGSTLRLQGAAGALPIGVHSADVTLATSDGKQSFRIPVTFTVSSGLSVPAGAALTVNNSTTAAQLQGTIGLVFAAGTSATEWIAVSDHPWFKLGAERGSVGTLPAWSIDPAAFNALPNNVTYRAAVRITTNSAMPARTFVFDASKALAEIKGLDSTALQAGQAGEVLLYGNGFSALPTGLAGVSVAGSQPTAVTTVSDKLMRVTMPAMAAGSYLVTLNPGSLLTTSGKPLHVAAAQAYAYQSLATEGRKASLVWDEVSKSLFVVNKTLKSVMRYAAVGGSFQLVTTRSFAFVDAVAMTSDRSALILQSGNSKVYKLSPTDLSTRAVYDIPGATASESDLDHRLTVMGDNRLMVGNSWLDLDSGQVRPIAYAENFGTHGSAAWGAVSGNGLRMMVPASGRSTPAPPIMYFDLNNGVMTRYGLTATPYFYDYAVNHAGTKFAFNGQVVDFSLNVLGNYRAPTGWYGFRPTMSRSGARLYLYSGSESGSQSRIHVFDTSQALVSTVNFPLLGHIDVPELPECVPAAVDCYFNQVNITMSDDSQTLFLAGGRRVVVLPVPSAMRSAAPLREGTSMVPARALIPRTAN